MRSIFLKLIEFYRRYLSVLSFGSCRYYPTCSAYAKLHFQHNNILLGIWASILRILRCNQLFRGGIDHPKVVKKFKRFPYVYIYKSSKTKIKFWFVPEKKGNFYVIKQINFK